MNTFDPAEFMSLSIEERAEFVKRLEAFIDEAIPEQITAEQYNAVKAMMQAGSPTKQA